MKRCRYSVSLEEQHAVCIFSISLNLLIDGRDALVLHECGSGKLRLPGSALAKLLVLLLTVESKF